MSAAKKPAKAKSAATSKAASGKKTTARTPKKTPAKKGTTPTRGHTSVKKTNKATTKTAKKTTRTTMKKSSTKTVAKTPAKKVVAKKTAAKKAAPKATSGKKKTVAKAPVQQRGGGAVTRSTGKVSKVDSLERVDKPVAGKPQKKALIRRRTLPKPPPAKKPRPAKLDKETLKRIREQLEQEKADLQRQQLELEEDSFEGSQSDLTGEVGLDEDFADAGTATFDRERDLSIRNNIRDLVEQIGRAITRIDEGVYGTCERCGQPIDAARLKALPHASLCLDCKRREERVR